MVLGTSNKMSRSASLLVHREIDNPKMVGRNLLTHQDATDFAPSGLPQRLAESRALTTRETDDDHRMRRVVIREAKLGSRPPKMNPARPSKARSQRARLAKSHKARRRSTLCAGRSRKLRA